MRSGLALGALCLLISVAHAAEPLSGDDIRKLFEGNTVSGRYMNGKSFSEFHHPDGRVPGHNRFVPNTDACWTTTEKHVCYYYGPAKERRTYCFTVEPGERLYILKMAESGQLNGVATIEPGNPRNHTDNGASWYCDGNISQRPSGRDGQGKTAMVED
jgi:hypothetical protein